MSEQSEPEVEQSTETNAQEYPFGLSSQQLFALVALVGIIGPGLAVYTLERANLPLAADLVWIVGYGTAVLVVWYIWLRPLDLIGSSDQDIFTREEAGSSTTEDDQGPSDQTDDTGSPTASDTSEETDESASSEPDRGDATTAGST